MIKNTGGTGCLQVTHALLGWCCRGKPHCNAGTVFFKKSAEQTGWKETSQRFIANRYIVLQESTTSRYDTTRDSPAQEDTWVDWSSTLLFFSPLNRLLDIGCLLIYSWVIILGLIGNSGFVLRNLCALLEVLLYLSRVWIEHDPNPLSLVIFQPLICVWGVRLL